MARTPFFGRGPAPQIARMDMQAATAPGRNWGAAIESIGQTVGQAVEKHREHKKAKKKERDFIESFEARMSKSPEFARSLGLNTEDTDEIRLAGKVYFSSPERRGMDRDYHTARMNAQFMEQRGILVGNLKDKKEREEGLARL